MQETVAQTPDPERHAFMLMAAARSAIEVAGEALRLAEERKSEVIDPGGATIIVDGLRMERSLDGPASRRGVIGAQAFLSNLVVVENCLVRLAGLTGMNPDIVGRVQTALEVIRAVVDRKLRNTAEHVDERVLERDGGLIVSTFFEGDLFCSTRRDGSIGGIAVTQATLDLVTDALDRIFWSEAQIAAIRARHPARFNRP